eukprot:1704573-Rhodomonas_salina.2
MGNLQLPVGGGTMLPWNWLPLFADAPPQSRRGFLCNLGCVGFIRVRSSRGNQSSNIPDLHSMMMSRDAAT